MKMQKSLIFVNKNLKINICYYAGKYRGASHSLYSLKYSVAKKAPIKCS